MVLYVDVEGLALFRSFTRALLRHCVVRDRLRVRVKLRGWMFDHLDCLVSLGCEVKTGFIFDFVQSICNHILLNIKRATLFDILGLGFVHVIR